MKFAAAILLALASCVGCTPSNSPTVPPTVGNVGVCVFDTVSKDMLAGMSFPDAVVDAAIKCFGGNTPANIAQVENLWSSGKTAFERTRGLDGGGNRD